VERDDDIADESNKDVEHRKRHFVLNSKMNWKPVKTG